MRVSESPLPPHSSAGGLPVSLRGRTSQAGSPCLSSLPSQSSFAPTPTSCSPWVVLECTLSAEEAEEAAREFFPSSVLQGLSSPNGTERKDACGSAAQWWTETCRCSECCEEETRAAGEAPSVWREDACLDRVRLSYAPHLLLFMRLKVRDTPQGSAKETEEASRAYSPPEAYKWNEVCLQL